mgnify:FL=1
MDRFSIRGGRRLTGEVSVGGAKNAALVLMAAAILGRGRSVIRRVPDLSDIRLQSEILQELGVRCERNGNGTLVLEPVDESR